MGTLKNVCSPLLRTVLRVNKQFQLNCKYSSSLNTQAVVDSVPKTTIAESEFKSQPVASTKNVVQTTTAPLTDTFGRHHTYLRISLTERCNLRFFQHPVLSWNIDSKHTHIQLTSLLSQDLPKHIIQKRFSHLSHIDADGKAKMVDVSEKNISNRQATARAVVEVGPEITELIDTNNMSKGDVLSIAQISGIMGAKKTSELIPLCHNIFLSSVKVSATLNKPENSVIITATVRCSGKTGVEMEALTAVSIAALTIYDMCKAVSHDIVIKDVRLWEKSGGKRYFKREK